MQPYSVGNDMRLRAERLEKQNVFTHTLTYQHTHAA